MHDKITIKKQWLWILSFIYFVEWAAETYQWFFNTTQQTNVFIEVAIFLMATFLFFIMPFLFMYDSAYKHNGIKLLLLSMLIRSSLTCNYLIKIINQIKSGCINWNSLVYNIFFIGLLIIFLLSSYRLYKLNKEHLHE